MTVLDMLEICRQKEKRLVVYISMAFGNPYGDPWSSEIAIQWTQKLVKAGVRVISLADTVGLASPSQVNELTNSVITEFPAIETVFICTVAGRTVLKSWKRHLAPVVDVLMVPSTE